MSKSGADILKSLKGKSQGFMVPENYFETFEVKISSEKHKEKVLLPKKSGFTVPENYFELTPLKPLDLIKKSAQKKGFKVPENYFDNFEVEIPKAKVNFNLYKLKVFQFTAVAASLLLILAIGNFMSSKNTIDTQVEISMKDLESWFDDYAGGLTTTEIVDTYDDLTLNLTSINFNGEIADYLAEEDLEDIIIQEEP